MKMNITTIMILAATVVVAGTITGAHAQSTEDSMEAPAEMPSPFAPGQSIYLGDPMITALTTQLPLLPFDMANGNAVFGVVIPNMGTWIHQEVSPHFADPSLSFRYVTLILNAGYDATAPYHETAVGVYSRIDNRPASESEDSTNINIASIYSVYRLALAFDPDRTPQWRAMLTDNGLDPDDDAGLDLDCSRTHDLDSPIAIGNLAGKCVLEGRMGDGFNHFGEETPGQPFRDTTGYTPVNSANELVDPSRWQPLTIKLREGTYTSQQFTTPQWAVTEPYSNINPRDFRSPPPLASDHAFPEEYKAQTDEVIDAVASLTDEQKMLVEFFDNKARETLFFPAVEALPNTIDFWQLDFMLHIAQFDAGIVTWQEKARYDAVRPITAIQYLYGDERIRTYGIGSDTIRFVTGSEWQSYAKTGDHPEYPSATSCFCAAQAQAWRNYLGGDEIPDVTLPNGDVVDGYIGVLPAGSSIHEPGITPANDVVVTYDTWTEYERDCADSRVWAGLHFRTAVEESLDLCSDIGNAAYNYFQTLLDGTAPLRQPAEKLDSDPLLERPHYTGR